MKSSFFLRIGFWTIITLIFLYDRRILIEKAQLPHLIECLIVRVGLLIGLTNFNLNYLVPKFFEAKRYLLYFSTLLLALLAYVSAQQLYDIYLYNYVIGASIPKTFTGSFLYTFVTTCWYLMLTVAFHLSLEWYGQRSVLKQMMAESEYLKTSGPAKIESHNNVVRLKTGGADVEMPVDEILYIQGLKDYSIIYTASNKIVVYGNLKSMERRLPEKEFQRVHKSYLVAINKVTRKERSKMWINSNEIPVGRTYQKMALK